MRSNNKAKDEKKYNPFYGNGSMRIHGITKEEMRRCIYFTELSRKFMGCTFYCNIHNTLLSGNDTTYCKYSCPIYFDKKSDTKIMKDDADIKIDKQQELKINPNRDHCPICSEKFTLKGKNEKSSRKTLAQLADEGSVSKFKSEFFRRDPDEQTEGLMRVIANGQTSILEFVMKNGYYPNSKVIDSAESIGVGPYLTRKKSFWLDLF